MTTSGFVVNARYAARPMTGVQRYATEIVGRLGSRVTPMQPSAAWSGGARGYAWEQVVLPFTVRGKPLWSPCNVGPIRAARHAVTIHDVAPLEHPEWFSRRYATAMRALLPVIARRAAHVFTVSKFSQERIVRLLGVPEERTSVTYNGVRTPEPLDDLDGIATLERLGLTPASRFLLVVGSREPRKNLAELIGAFDAWKRPHDVELLVVGSLGERQVFAGGGDVTTVPGVRLLGRVDDRQLSVLYRTAKACAFVPLYEGFGLPALEALAHGTQVIASDIPPLREACGSHAMYVDPRSRGELITAMDVSVRAPAPHAPGLAEHLSGFSWTASAALVSERMAML